MVETADGGEKQPLELFLGIGLDNRTAENALVNAKVTANLTAVIKEAGVVDGCSKNIGNLLYTVATKYPAHAFIHRPTLLQEYIVTSKVPFTKVIYIEQSDFRTKDSKDYYGLAPGKSVLLRYAFPIKCTEVVYDDSGSVAEIRAEYDPSKKTKPKGVLHWVAQPSPGVDPLKVEVRLFDKLFMSENPAELEDKWLTDLNPNSKEVIPEAYAVPSLANAALGYKFQFERLGYFAVDTDSRPDKLVFNRTVTLRDSYTKGK